MNTDFLGAAKEGGKSSTFGTSRPGTKVPARGQNISHAQQHLVLYFAAKMSRIYGRQMTGTVSGVFDKQLKRSRAIQGDSFTPLCVLVQ